MQQIEYYIPKWVEMLEESHEIKQDLLEKCPASWTALRRWMSEPGITAQSSFIRAMKQEAMDSSSGTLKVQVDFDSAYYYRTLPASSPARPSTGNISSLRRCGSCPK